MAKKKDPRVAAAFHEVYTKVPKTVKATGKTGEAKEKMMTAIALDKARRAGAKIPVKKMQMGGMVTPARTIGRVPGAVMPSRVAAPASGRSMVGMTGTPPVIGMHKGGVVPAVKSVKMGSVKVKFHKPEEKPATEAMHQQPDYRPTPIKTEPATQFPLDKHPAAMVIPKNTEGSPIPGTHSSTSAHPALANRAVEHFEHDGIGGSGTRTRTADGVTSIPGHQVTEERKAHISKARAAKEDAFKK